MDSQLRGHISLPAAAAQLSQSWPRYAPPLWRPPRLTPPPLAALPCPASAPENSVAIGGQSAITYSVGNTVLAQWERGEDSGLEDVTAFRIYALFEVGSYGVVLKGAGPGCWRAVRWCIAGKLAAGAPCWHHCRRLPSVR